MPTLIITRGLQGSGKSHKSKAWVRHKPAERVRVNVDGLRAMGHDRQVILANEDTLGTEPIIQAGRDALVRTWLSAGFDVVVDELGLRDEIVRHLLGLAAECGAKVKVWDLTNVPLELCRQRNAARPETERVPDERLIARWQEYIEGRGYPLPMPSIAA